ncbi:hypothetical protein IAQ61_004549 [Plenodomus lingam]|uniref:uncharacterized protein n=1 Tax=Leptosphaeria maculans TaxID=5022 RepID=UPI003323C352|nr:hypothetical protein IAQ61_004549 [Plenodomus lingam]
MQHEVVAHVISSIAGEVTAILASKDVTIPTAVITSAINGVIKTLEPSASTAEVTRVASSIEAAASSAADVSVTISFGQCHTNLHNHDEDRCSSRTLNRKFQAIHWHSYRRSPRWHRNTRPPRDPHHAHPPPQETKSLITNSRRQRSQQPSTSFSDLNRSSTLISTSPPTFDAGTPTLPGCTLAGSPVVPGASAAGYDPYPFASHTLYQQPGNQHHNPYTEEKTAFHMQAHRPNGNEMPTNADKWELDGKEMAQHP